MNVFMMAGWMHYRPLRQHAAPVRECLVHSGEGTIDIQMSTCIRPWSLEAADPPPLCTHGVATPNHCASPSHPRFTALQPWHLSWPSLWRQRDMG